MNQINKDDDRPLDINWARENLKGFRKWQDDVRVTKEDEGRYKQNPGYVPRLINKIGYTVFAMIMGAQVEMFVEAARHFHGHN